MKVKGWNAYVHNTPTLEVWCIAPCITSLTKTTNVDDDPRDDIPRYVDILDVTIWGCVHIVRSSSLT